MRVAASAAQTRSRIQPASCWPAAAGTRLRAQTRAGGAVAGIYGGAWSGPVLVLTHHPERLASDATVEAVSDLGTALARAEELADGRAVSIFGADVARQVLALGRLDEIIVQIVPLVLGDGVRLFGEAPAPQVRLERTYVGTSGTLTDIRFRVAGPPTIEFGLDGINDGLDRSLATLPKPRRRTVTARNVPLGTSSSAVRHSLLTRRQANRKPRRW